MSINLQTDGFEWDEDKRLANIAERGVDFRRAVLIFQNSVVEAVDTRKDYGEERIRAIGRVADEVYVIAYTWRRRRRRIISAWKVGNDGRRRYETLLDQ